jgi:small subunit ribosomal protein S20
LPTNSSTAKRNRQNAVRRDRNRQTKGSVRTANKRFLAAVKAGDKDKATAEFQQFCKLMDTATGKGVFHSNTAARKKSRLNKQLNALGA